MKKSIRSINRSAVQADSNAVKEIAERLGRDAASELLTRGDSNDQVSGEEILSFLRDKVETQELSPRLADRIIRELASVRVSGS